MGIHWEGCIHEDARDKNWGGCDHGVVQHKMESLIMEVHFAGGVLKPGKRCHRGGGFGTSFLLSLPLLLLS